MIIHCYKDTIEDDDELLSIERGVREFNPQGFDAYYCDTWSLLGPNPKFNPIFGSCAGCRKVYWMGLNADGTGKTIISLAKDYVLMALGDPLLYVTIVFRFVDALSSKFFIYVVIATSVMNIVVTYTISRNQKAS